jgi:glycosyltransferase involved in cell wall biosynthesis
MRLLVEGGFNANLAAQIEDAGWDVEIAGESWRDLCDRCAVWRPDVLLGLGAPAVRRSAAAALRFRVPFLAVADGRESAPERGCLAALARWSYRRASAVVCASEFARRRALQYGIPHHRIEMIADGVDDTAFRPLDWHEIEMVRSSLPARAWRWLLSAGPHLRKRHVEDFIRALPLVLESERATHYAIAGPQGLGEEIAPLAASLGVSAHVHCLNPGPVGRLARLMGACELVLVSGRRPEEDDAESDAAVLQAGLCGTPAIVTSGGGVEAVLPGITGACTPLGDTWALAGAIVSLLADGRLRREMGKAARRRARERSWSRVAASYLALLSEIGCAARQHPARDEAVAQVAAFSVRRST